MKHVSKRALTLCIALIFALSVTSGALAADANAIELQLNGQILDLGDAAPIILDGSTFVPLRALLEALGAEVEWEPIARTILVTRGDSSVLFTIGQNTAVVTTPDSEATVAIAAAPFLSDAKTYIPVRATAELFGMIVGWDGVNRTVIIDDVDTLLAENTATYEIANKLLAYSAEASKGNVAVDGTFDAIISVVEGEEEMSIEMEGTVSGIASQNVAELSLEASTNIADLLGDEELDDASAQMLAALEAIEMDYIFNIDSGMYYLSSPLLATLLGITGDDVWLSLDASSLLDVSADLGIGTTDLLDSLSALESAETVEDMLAVLLSVDPVSRDLCATNLLALVNLFLSDDSFEATADGYTADYSSLISEFAGEALEGFVCKLSLTMKDDEVVGYDLEVAFADADVSLELTISVDADNTTTLFLSLSAADVVDMLMEIVINQSATDKVPASAPSAESTVIPLDDILSALMAPVAEAPLAETAEADAA